MNSHDLKVSHQVKHSLQIPSIEEDKIDLRYTKHDTSKCIQQSTQKQTKTTTQSGQFETSDLAMKPNAARKGTSSRSDRCLNRALGSSTNEASCPKLKAKELLYKWDRADFLQLQKSKTLIVILPSPDTFGTAIDVHKGAFLSLGYLVSTVLEKHEALQSPVRRCLKTRLINAGCRADLWIPKNYFQVSRIFLIT